MVDYLAMARLVITRESFNFIKDIVGKKGAIIYGRRKTGKTFFVKNTFKKARYFYVYRSREVFDEKYNRVLTYKEFLSLLNEIDDIIVIDEFHRLGENFLDFLHNYSKREKLILVTSTPHYYKTLLGEENPILGFFVNVKFDLPFYREILKSLHNKKDKLGDRLVDYLAFLKEVSLCDFYTEDFNRFLQNSYHFAKTFFKSLLFEIFNEEEKELTSTYYGIITAIASNYNTASEISSRLYSLGLIEKESPSLISPHLKVLEEIGILKRVKIYGKRKKYLYYLSSIPMEFFLYLYEKYNLDERDIDPQTLLKEYNNKRGFYVERVFMELMAEIKGLSYRKIQKPELDIDFALVDEKENIKEIYEVKWKNEIKAKDIKKLLEKVEQFEKPKKYLIVKDKRLVERYYDILEESNIRVLDINDIIRMAVQH